MTIRSLVSGRQLGNAILEALGVQLEGVLSVEIGTARDDVATVTVTRAVRTEEACKIVETVQRYALLEQNPTKREEG